ncbi:MAG: pilus assembly protein TadG-related protein [Cypionkella sp.]
MFDPHTPINQDERLPSMRAHLRHRLAQGLLAFGADTSGAVAIMAALLMPVLVLGMGLGAETGYQYMTQRNLQNAADLAAHAGGVRLRAGDTKAAITAAALHVATDSGFVAAKGSFTVNTPPTRGPNAGSASSVEVLLTRDQPRFFSALIMSKPLLMGARAVATVTASASAACVLALSSTAQRAISISGSTDVSLQGCDVASNSNASDAFWMANSSAKLAVNCVDSVGGAVTSSNLQLIGCPAAKEYQPVVRDPYADVAEPSINIPCEANTDVTVFSPTYAHPSGVMAMRICGGLDIKKQVTFKPGLYIIDGGDLTLNANGTVASADAGMTVQGATFFLTGNAKLKMTGNGGLDLQAPTSGPFSGILIFGSRSQTGLTYAIQGNSGSTTQGAIYVPTSAVSFSGNSNTTNGCTQIIGRTVEFTGNSTLRSSCTTGNARPIETNVIVRITE